MTNLGFPFTTSTVTATPLSRSSTQGPAFSIQTSITLNSELFLLKFLLPPRSLFTDFCQLTVSSSGLRSSLYNPICVYRVPQRYPMTQSQIKLLRMYPRLCCLQLTQVHCKVSSHQSGTSCHCCTKQSLGTECRKVTP